MATTIRDKKTDELSAAEIKELIDDAARMGVKHLSIHGGEPLLRPDFCEILEYAARKGLHTSTFTNATLITEEVAQCCTRHLHDVGISIHGGETTHDLVAGLAGSYRKVMDGLLRLQAVKRSAGTEFPHIHLTCVVSGLNYEHLDEMVPVAQEAGLKDIWLSMVTFTDQRAVDASCRMLAATPTEPLFLGDSLVPRDVLQVDAPRYQQAMARLRAAAAAADIKVWEYPFKSEQDIASYFSNPLARLGRHCDYPWYSSVVSAYGDVYPCIQLSFSGFNMGNIRDQRFPAIWKSAAYRTLRQEFARHDRYLPVCAKCCSVTDER
jgi:radical SAM protein with 4Fe4S-binding SPASM domain